MAADCVSFLHWALPQLGLAWPGFRRVRRQVCRRIGHRIQELRLPDPTAYRRLLETTPDEWAVLEHCCRITISRFFRDWAVFKQLRDHILPQLAAGVAEERRHLRAWSAGCASGEEPYSLAILWRLGLDVPTVGVEIVATDVDQDLLERARRALYPPSSLREVPAPWRLVAFEPERQGFRVRPEFREGVSFLQQDLRRENPSGRFDLILCRNVAFTYFDDAGRRATLRRFASLLYPNGVLVIGREEALPEGEGQFRPCSGAAGIHSFVTREAEKASPACT